MNKYAKHFLLDVVEAKKYAVEVLHYFDEKEELESIEIGDGNINYVFKVWNPSTNKSVIIKQADTVLRSSGRPLDMHRNKIEAEILRIEGELTGSFVPENLTKLLFLIYIVIKNLKIIIYKQFCLIHLVMKVRKLSVE